MSYSLILLSILLPLGLLASEKSDEYLKDLQPKVIKYSDSESVTIPTAPFQVKLTEEDAPQIYQSQKIPWSSWWYPNNSKEFFEDYSIVDQVLGEINFRPSLRVYDSIFNRKGDKSTLEYLKPFYDGNSSPWEGACTLWALASVYYEQPSEKTYCYYLEDKKLKDGRVVNEFGRYKLNDNSNSDEVQYCEDKKGGEVLFPGHAKSLLALSFSPLSDSAYFFDDYLLGQHNRGSGYLDINDIYPHEFLQGLIFQLGKNNFPAIMDYDMGEAIWNHPIYKLELYVRKKDEQTAKVTMKVFFKTPLQIGESAGLRYKDMLGPLALTDGEIPKVYTAELYGSFSGDTFVLNHQLKREEKSSWVGQSISSHPDTLMLPPPMSLSELVELNVQKRAELRMDDSFGGDIDSEVWLDRLLKVIDL